jgi:hypothetical protein
VTKVTKLKLAAVDDAKPVRITIELPADIDRDLRAYAELLKRESGRSVSDATKLIAPMLKRFMATDRAFTKFKRQSAQDRTA